MIEMTQVADIEVERIALTAGDIAAINLESARQRSWNRFWRAPQQPQIAEMIVEQEQLTAQFIGDLAAFDRLETLVRELTRVEPESARTALIAAQVACSTHRFAEARESLAQAAARGAPIGRDGTPHADHRPCHGDESLGGAGGADASAPRGLDIGRSGSRSGRCWRIWVNSTRPDRTYIEALRTYPDVSPFAPAWTAFQLGVLWEKACLHRDWTGPWSGTALRSNTALLREGAGAPLRRSISIRDACTPRRRSSHRRWRAAIRSVLAPGRRRARCRERPRGALHLAAARSGFEALLAKHPLAFADHGAEFYAGSGNDPGRASSSRL
jgi:hypothetical protein